MNRNRVLRIFLILIILMLSMVGCRPKDGEEPSIDHGSSDTISLVEPSAPISNWDGVWNNLGNWAVEDTQVDLADSLKSHFGNGWEPRLSSDFVSIKVVDTSVVVYTRLQQDDSIPRGDILYDLLYTAQGEVTDQEGTVWHLFENNKEGPYRYLALQELQQEEPRVFAYRYGADGFDALLTEQDWLPLMVDASAELALLPGALA